MSIRPDGIHRLYRARREGLTEVWQFIDEMWTDWLARLKRVDERAERMNPEDERPERSEP